MGKDMSKPFDDLLEEKMLNLDERITETSESYVP